MSIMIGNGGGRVVLIHTQTLTTGLDTGLFTTGYSATAARVMIVVVITQVAGNGQWDLYDSTGIGPTALSYYNLSFNTLQKAIGFYSANANNCDSILVRNNTNNTGTCQVYALF